MGKQYKTGQKEGGDEVEKEEATEEEREGEVIWSEREKKGRGKKTVRRERTKAQLKKKKKYEMHIG